eukprot:CAMPEP_0183296312 /NCGR_PEP_ID=MMETSP0160_2-20130417/3924_1 /TAXON_ID=2839 ORGANISM="Odontella Sinensis, Strain Grunow 1884" /NCGR_SAMPLE_ID=MMETSP0160_2 /ASSEMBLY_ACC=CAM_ASM_000250 /LENGTH=401 /DNA_ID=CAMNT_0025457915 /DNA_START=116 /DNA_END=1318 /DNA_ORIENTATION=-
MTFSDRLKSIDSHTSVASEFRVRTWHGALLSVLTLLLSTYLVYTEYRFNFATEVVDRVKVNATSPDGLEMEFDVTFPSVPCALLSVDANDPTGQPQSLHIDRTHRVFKHRMKDGRMIGRRSKFEVGGTVTSEGAVRGMAKDLGIDLTKEDDLAAALAERAARKAEAGAGASTSTSTSSKSGDEISDEEECGSCYGAADEGECCNTCDDVKRAYQARSWHIDITKVSQCRHQVSSKDEEGEGCNVHGTVALSTGGGNLHIAPGRGLEKFGTEREAEMGMVSLMEFLTQTFETFNVTHTVNRVRFGGEYPGSAHQLDGQARVVTDEGAMYQYYVQVVPTLYKHLDGTEIRTNQYSVTEHLRHVNPGSGRGMPGVFFFYEVSPLHVEMEEVRRGWVRFMTSVCA